MARPQPAATPCVPVKPCTPRGFPRRSLILAKFNGIFFALVLIGFGIAMLVAPDALVGETASGRRSGTKALLIAIWGIPAGILLTLGGLGWGAWILQKT